MEKIIPYRVLNSAPGAPALEKPGIRLGKEANSPVVESFKAVILFGSGGRRLNRGKGANFRTMCQSGDNLTPALKIKEPLCRNTTAEDVAKIVGAFKGFDKAKIETTVGTLTAGTPQLQLCGIRTNKDGNEGLLPICPFARYDSVAGRPGPCQEIFTIFGYDIERQALFRMDLHGLSISTYKTIAPIRDFYRLIQSMNKPSFSFSLKLYAKQAHDNRTYILGVGDVSLIKKEENIKKMETYALEARAYYENGLAKEYVAQTKAPQSPNSLKVVDSDAFESKESKMESAKAEPQSMALEADPFDNEEVNF